MWCKSFLSIDNSYPPQTETIIRPNAAQFTITILNCHWSLNSRYKYFLTRYKHPNIPNTRWGIQEACQKPGRQAVLVKPKVLLIISDRLVKLTRAGANLSASFRRSCINKLKKRTLLRTSRRGRVVNSITVTTARKNFTNWSAKRLIATSLCLFPEKRQTRSWFLRKIGTPSTRPYIYCRFKVCANPSSRVCRPD